MPIRLKPNDPRIPPELRQAPRKRQRQPKADPAAFIALCVAAGLPAPIPEYRFRTGRQWAIDWAWPYPVSWLRRVGTSGGVALEVQGGIFTQGRHVRGAALLKEMEKLNALACDGWRVLFMTPEQFDRGDAIALVKRALGMEERDG